MANAELRRRPNESCLRLSDGREGLIEIGRYLTEISAVGCAGKPKETRI